MQDYVYASLSLVAVVIHLIINYDQLFGHSIAAAKASHYRGFLLGILAYYITDIAWGIFAGLGWTRALFIDTTLYFLALAVGVLEWCRFVCVYLKLKGWAEKLMLWFGYGFLAFDIVTLAINFFNGCFFGFDADGRYTVGPCRNISFTLQFMLNIVAAICAIVAAFCSKGVERRRNMLVFFLGLTMTIAFAVQVAYPLYPFTALGCLIGVCFFHIFVIEDELDEKRAAVIEREQAVKHMAELEVALDRAIAAEKSRSTFFSIVSHDIRTPLNAILGYSELLERGLKSDAEKEEALKSIRSSGKALLQLVNDVLDFAKMDSGKMILSLGPVRLDALADEIFSSFRLAAAKKGLKLVNRVPQMPALALDGHRVRQILFNLIGNAMKFTAEGSISVEASYSDGRLKLSVTDTGIGIAPEMLSRIFDPFVQALDHTHPTVRAEGSGLGLSICSSLVKLMGGELTVQSEPWKGTTFSIDIPQVAIAQEQTVQAAAAGEEDAVELAKLPKHVLVVDDSPVNCAVLKAFLKRIGVGSVDTAADGGEAFERLNFALRSGSPYDFVFTDYWMANINGPELAAKVRAQADFAGLPIFMVTADTEFLKDERAKLFTGILMKPVTYRSLVEVLCKD